MSITQFDDALNHIQQWTQAHSYTDKERSVHLTVTIFLTFLLPMGFLGVGLALPRPMPTPAGARARAASAPRPYSRAAAMPSPGAGNGRSNPFLLLYLHEPPPPHASWIRRRRCPELPLGLCLVGGVLLLAVLIQRWGNGDRYFQKCFSFYLSTPGDRGWGQRWRILTAALGRFSHRRRTNRTATCGGGIRL